MKNRKNTIEELAERIAKAVRLHMEGRKYPRLKKNLYVCFRKMDSMAEYSASTTNDIGMGGFRMDVVYLGEPISLDQVMEITLKDPDENKEPIKAIGRIAWIKEKKDSDDLEIGIMLTYMRTEDRRRFIGFLSEEEINARPF